jgi:hypothetical protein
MASDGQMIKCTGFTLMLSLSALALADTDGDAVNERIPVSRAELESHWQVDCATALTRLLAAAARPPNYNHCEITAEMVHDIKLCAFIYQAPGDNAEHPCPDYRRISTQLGQPGNLATDCPEFPASIAKQKNCTDEAL